MRPSSAVYLLCLASVLCRASLHVTSPLEQLPFGVWTQFNSWARTSPDIGRKYSVATSVVKLGMQSLEREMMIMYGGVGDQQRDAATWIYDPQANTWQSFLLSRHPSVDTSHSMASLCGRRVVLFGGANTRSERNSTDANGLLCKNETWIFDMNRKEWSFVAVRSGANGFILPRCKHTATAVYQPKSGCSCKESLFVYGGTFVTLEGTHIQKEDLSDMWELRCVKDGNDTGLPEFEWLPFQFSTNDSLDLTNAVAFSAFNKSELILSGWKDNVLQIWSLKIGKVAWRKRGSKEDLANEDRLVYLLGRNINSGTIFPILVYCCQEPMWAFNLDTGDWYKPDLIRDVAAPEMALDTATRATVGGRLLVFGGALNFRRPQDALWRLTALRPDLLQWTLLEAEGPNLQYKAVMVGGIVHENKVVLFGGSVTKPRRNVYSSDETWTLDLSTLVWSKSAVTWKPPGLAASAGAILRQSYLVVFGGVQLDVKKGIFSIAGINTNTFVYDCMATKWFTITTHNSPPARVLHTVLAVNDSTMITFGGFFVTVSNANGTSLAVLPRRDIWTFTLGNMYNLTQGGWSQAHDVGQWTYTGNAACFWNGTAVVYGGTNSDLVFTPAIVDKLSQRRKIISSRVISFTASCEDKIWEYDINTMNLEEVKYAQNSGPGARCFPSFGRVGNNLIIHGGCSLRAEFRLHLKTDVYEYFCSVEAPKTGVWAYFLNARKWTRLTAANPINVPLYGPLSLEWKGRIIMIGGASAELSSTWTSEDWTGFSVYKPECPAGMYTFDFPSTGCHPCPVGQYSSSSGKQCTSCPDSLSTLQVGSTSIDNCTVCSSAACDHGRCRVIVPGPEVYCECDFGYTKNDEGHCSIATYYLAGSGFLAGLLLLVLVAIVLFRFKKAKKSHQTAIRDKDRELIELTNGWTIDFRELKLRGRIDKSAPGGFGDVYKAEYREMTVAVKRLKEVMLELERTEMEFDREVEVMRTIRHPNIVLFLGVGRFQDDGCPFIVMEYMSRGSLGSILRNSSLSLTNSQQIRFALDAAKGMRFLHGLRPPRVHRDLKSGNLLVSERWVVKVADFGSARLVKEEAVDQVAVRGTGPLSLTAPLLQPQYELSTCVGTPFWTAPELLRGLSYGTAVDVYSFGVVLWEIWSHKLPFDDYHFPTVLDLKQAVMEGTRPTISSNWPSDYVGLIRECWNGAPSHRPTFGRIVERLENFNERHLLANLTM